MGNEILDIFSFDNLVEKSDSFGERGGGFWRHDHFLGGVILL